LSVQPGLCGSNDLSFGRKMATFQIFFQSGRAKDLSAPLYQLTEFFVVSVLYWRWVFWSVSGMPCFHLHCDWFWFTWILKSLCRKECTGYMG